MLLKVRAPAPELTAKLPVVASAPSMCPCSLLDLTTNTCRWPVGDPRAAGFFFCGAVPAAGEPYCRHHVFASTH